MHDCKARFSEGILFDFNHRNSIIYQACDNHAGAGEFA
jgi:hypothetical protein